MNTTVETKSPAGLGTFEESVWVLNNTDSILTIDVRMDGEQGVVKVPKTWVPIDLTIQAAMPDLVKSPHLKRAFAANMLRRVEKEEFDNIMARKGAREESQRISANIHASNLVDPSLLGRSNVSEAVVESKEVEARAAASEAQVTVALFRSYPMDERLGKFYALANTDKADKEVCLGLMELASESEDKDLFAAVEEHAKKL